MRLNSHKTVIQIISDAIEAWRKPLLRNREAVADDIVKAHHDIGGVERTGIWIEPPCAGRAEELRMKANADRIFRWLDDQEKDRNLLPVNFLPSLLAGLPMHVRVAIANEALAPCGLVVHQTASESVDVFDPIQHLEKFLVEFPEAKQAMMKMAHCRSEVTIRSVIKELDDVERVAKEARKGLESLLAQKSGLVVKEA